MDERKLITKYAKLEHDYHLQKLRIKELENRLNDLNKSLTYIQAGASCFNLNNVQIIEFLDKSKEVCIYFNSSDKHYIFASSDADYDNISSQLKELLTDNTNFHILEK